MILSKTLLERVSNVSIGLYLFVGVPWVLVDLMFFLIYFMWPFSVAVEGGMCFISSTMRLVQVVKWTFLISWSKVLLTELKMAAWYNLASSVLILAARALSAAGCCLLGG